MEIFFTGLPLSVKESEFSVAFANCIHGAEFANFSPSGLPSNFKINIWPTRRRGPRSGSGQMGTIILISVDLANHFLRLYGRQGPRSRSQLRFTLRQQQVHFERVKSVRPPPSADVVAFLKGHPWEHPEIGLERERRAEALDGDVLFTYLEFGWACRDGNFSAEWRTPTSSSRATLQFNDSRRELRLSWPDINADLGLPLARRAIVARYGSIEAITLPHRQTEADHSICLNLRTAPTYESEPSEDLEDLMASISLNKRQRRTRLRCLHDDFLEHAPYVSHCIRIMCSSRDELAKFRRMSGEAGLVKADLIDYERVERRLFSVSALSTCRGWIAGYGQHHWPVAFQLECLLRSGQMDALEIVRLHGFLTDTLRTHPVSFTANGLRTFASELRLLPWYTNHSDVQFETPLDCLKRTMLSMEMERQSGTELLPHDAALHIQKLTYTPTTFFLSGPEPEQSNRVLRRFVDNLDSFLRVTFTDNDKYNFHFDREVDVPSFVKMHVGQALRDGITVAGRHFKFLAYSSSALKEHSVWFVTPFNDASGMRHTAQSIRDGLGTFKKEIYCPARLGARMSQAFSATDPSVEVEEVIMLPDIPNGASGTDCMTDGIGTCSREFADEVWAVLEARRSKRKVNRKKRSNPPSAYQIRYQGAKGMISVDYKLEGSVICLRDSMIKFEDAISRELEIARSFDSPGRMYLNRPLVCLLEGLGIQKKVFLDLQSKALADIHMASSSMETAGKLLETHGLGTAFKLPSLFGSLHKLLTRNGAINNLIETDDFTQRVMDFAVNHMRRELKYRARIPVPDSWTLVGVVDVHKYLKPREIFVCIRPRDSRKALYLEGPILVTRSPVIHPGDVQMVHAIGEPPPDSPFIHEELQNCVVFSVNGSRSIGSMLGGGDYDGDLYNICPLLELHPPRTCEPATYPPAERHILPQPATIDDIADFVVEFINSDLLGVIATNHLLIADSTEEHIFHPDCLKLADLHSIAVDYPKSGKPVPHQAIPAPSQKKRPDWNGSELTENNNDHYRSNRALGELFRAITLDAVDEATAEARAQSRQLRAQQVRVPMSSRSVFEALAQQRQPPESGLSALVLPIRQFTEEHIELRFSSTVVSSIMHLYNKYCSDLLFICQDNVVSGSKTSQLTEEEVVAGTIVAKTHIARRRKEAISNAREQAARLVHGVQEELAGDDSCSSQAALLRSWTAWELSMVDADRFGSKSFGLVALLSIFDIVKQILDENASVTSRTRRRR
ncbi:RdRP-domain-containing protein [Auriculariales sp. MPI-PUGE-AT-0066]|nr:RdRP-domain-containing protein [Auriculariales sp. MPI-PUGE-AT-0066]